MQLHQSTDTHSMQESRPVNGASLHIRLGKVEDIPAIMRLGGKTFRDAYGPYNDPETMARPIAPVFPQEQGDEHASAF